MGRDHPWHGTSPSLPTKSAGDRHCLYFAVVALAGWTKPTLLQCGDITLLAEAYLVVRHQLEPHQLPTV